MREFQINKNDSGQRLDKFIQKSVPLLPKSLLNKYVRLKRIKCNGKRTDFTYKLNEGDLLQLYINDEFFEEKSTKNDNFKNIKADINVLYEDDNILLLDKKIGMLCQPDDANENNTLVDNLKAYLYTKGEYDPEKELSFSPALCNRIDRNTGGIVIACKNSEALRIMNEKVKYHEMEKRYLCIVLGKMKHESGTFSNYLLKDNKTNKVMVYPTQVKDSKTAVSHYKTIRTNDELSLVECNLITGRTHQIRAQFSYAGHPLLGDGKYGKNSENKKYKVFKQSLYSYKLKFSWKTDAGILEYLNGKSFKVANVPFESLIK